MSLGVALTPASAHAINGPSPRALKLAHRRCHALPDYQVILR
jgi:hypothetical protein